MLTWLAQIICPLEKPCLFLESLDISKQTL